MNFSLIKFFILIFFILPFYTKKNIFSEEITPSINIGYNHTGGISVLYFAEDGRVGDSHSGWEELDLGNLYLTLFAQNTSIVGGLGWGIKYGFQSFHNKRQRFDLAEGTSKYAGTQRWGTEGDLGSEIKGNMAYIVPVLYYQFFRQSSISLLLGYGFGGAFVQANGNIFLTDKHNHASPDVDVSQCLNYIRHNDPRKNVENYCEKKEINYSKFSGAYSPHIGIIGKNFGAELSGVGTFIEKHGDDEIMFAAGVMAIYYRKKF